MVCDCQVFQTGVSRRRRHRLDIRLSIGRGGMTVQVATEIGPLDQMRKVPHSRGLDLAAMLPQFGRDIRESKRFVHVGLGGAGNILAVSNAKQAIFVQFESSPQRDVPHRDVVGLRPREILCGGTRALGRDHTQIDLDTAAQQDARLGRPLTEYALDVRESREMGHQCVGRIDSQEIDVATRLFPAA